jgi:hypothetical protein
VLIATWTIIKERLGQHIFSFKDLVKKKLYPDKASIILYLQRKSQKITMKIDIKGTCPNFQMFVVGTLVLLGIKEV